MKKKRKNNQFDMMTQIEMSQKNTMLNKTFLRL